MSTRPDASPSADLQVLAPWAPELADTFVALSCDIALVLDEQGRIQRMAQHEQRPIAPADWLGRPWADTAAPDSRAKVEGLLADAAGSGYGRRREVNHPQARGGGAAVAYSTVRLGEHGPTLAIGHDMREKAAMQQRFLAAQEALERSYWNAQRNLATAPRQAERPAVMTQGERASLGLGPGSLDDTELGRALGHLVDRIDTGRMPGLMRDARRLAERHFLELAVQRAGSEEALARTLGVSRESISRRRRG